MARVTYTHNADDGTKLSGMPFRGNRRVRGARTARG